MPYISREAEVFARAHPTLLGVRLRKAVSRHELREVIRQRIAELTAEEKRERESE